MRLDLIVIFVIVDYLLCVGIYYRLLVMSWAVGLCGIMVGLISPWPRFQLSDFDLMTKQGNFKMLRGVRLRQN